MTLRSHHCTNFTAPNQTNMKQRNLATAALLATTLLAGLGAVKSEQANHLAGDAVRKGIGTSQNSNNGGGSDEFVGMLLIGGVVVACGVAANKVLTLHRLSSRTTHQVTGGDKPETIKDCDNALPLSPNDTSSSIERAYAHFKQGDRSRAIEDFNEAILNNPNSADLYGERANFRQKNLGDKQGAIEDYTNAIRLNPQNALFYFWRSQTHHALGNAQRAIEDYNEAVRLAPEDTMYYCFEDTAKSKKR